MNTSEHPCDAFAHVGDLHFWSLVWNPLALLNKRFLGNLNVALRRRREFPMERAEAFADYLVDTGISSALLTGDLTSTATPEEYAMARGFLDGLASKGMSLWLMPGNHDVYTFEAARARRFERCFEDVLPAGGFPARSNLPGGTPLIQVPTVRPNILSSRGFIGMADIERVKRLLEDCRGPVVVAAHYPVLYDTHGYHSTPTRRLINAEALRRALGESGLRILYVAGHVHRFSYTRDRDFTNLSHLTSGGFFHYHPSKGCHGGFSEVHVTEQGFSVFHHTHQDGWRRTRVEPAGP